MIRILTETRTVYRSEVGRRARLTKRTAYLDAARAAFKAKYPCDCEPDVGHECLLHRGLRWDEDGEVDGAGFRYQQKVTHRLARWLMWRDSRFVECEKCGGDGKSLSMHGGWGTCATCKGEGAVDMKMGFEACDDCEDGRVRR